MCTFNIALDDKVVNTARKAFRTDENLTEWMEEQITVLLSNYVSLSGSQPKRKQHKHDTLMGILSNVPEAESKRMHLKEKYGL